VPEDDSRQSPSPTAGSPCEGQSRPIRERLQRSRRHSGLPGVGGMTNKIVVRHGSGPLIASICGRQHPRGPRPHSGSLPGPGTHRAAGPCRVGVPATKHRAQLGSEPIGRALDRAYLRRDQPIPAPDPGGLPTHCQGTPCTARPAKRPRRCATRSRATVAAHASAPALRTRDGAVDWTLARLRRPCRRRRRRPARRGGASRRHRPPCGWPTGRSSTSPTRPRAGRARPRSLVYTTSTVEAG
jgi:hypothetical protein